VTPAAWVGFVAAGASGASVRFIIDALVGDRGFPWATFMINASGSLLLGFLTGLGLYHAFPTTDRLILGTGFCGAYTTFSTFSFDTVRLIEDGSIAAAARNAFGTLLVCAAAAGAGLVVAMAV
jgi:CrcB protein